MFFIVMEISVSVSFFSSFLYRHSWREWKMMKDGSLSRSEGRGKGGSTLVPGLLFFRRMIAFSLTSSCHCCCSIDE